MKIVLFAGEAIRLKRFGVPGAVRNGSSLFLHCDFALEAQDLLYSVKWYRNNLEFYRYLIKPGQTQPEHKVFHQFGIYIDVSILKISSLVSS